MNPPPAFLRAVGVGRAELSSLSAALWRNRVAHDHSYALAVAGEHLGMWIFEAGGIGKRLQCTLAQSGRTESTILLEESEALEVAIPVEDDATAKV
jgi:hypothetical protein